MEYRQLGRSGLRVPVLACGTALFGDTGQRFKHRGTVDEKLAARMVDICLERGANLFDTADTYAGGASEAMLGQVIKGRRDRLLVATKATFPTGAGPNDWGSSRQHLIAAVETSLKRLGTDHIDLFQLHQQDSITPIEETVAALDQLIRDGKVRYVGCSNYAGWRLMKALAAADRHGFARFVSHQAYYSLLDRDYEWELMPLGLDQGVGALVWSPLAWGRLTGKIRRDAPPKAETRATDPGAGVQLRDEARLYDIVDVMLALAAETGRTAPQIAINWLLRRPTVASVLLGARDEAQLLDLLGAGEFVLTPEQVARLDAASAVRPPYPAWQHEVYPPLNPPVI